MSCGYIITIPVSIYIILCFKEDLILGIAMTFGYDLTKGCYGKMI